MTSRRAQFYVNHLKDSISHVSLGIMQVVMVYAVRLQPLVQVVFFGGKKPDAPPQKYTGFHTVIDCSEQVESNFIPVQQAILNSDQSYNISLYILVKMWRYTLKCFTVAQRIANSILRYGSCTLTGNILA